MDDRIDNRARFDLIRYANCWEDADILCEALQPAPGCRFLSIASAGDNALALLAGGATVVAADLSAAQLACLELRCAAFKTLTHGDLLAFLGCRPCAERAALYAALRADLSPAARAYWDSQAARVQSGVIHTGKFESYFRLFRTRVLGLIHSAADIDELLREKDLPARIAFYEQRWDNLRWRLCFRLFFSRCVMGRIGRDPEFFRYVEGSVSERILARARHGFTHVPTHNNPYLSYIMRGNFGDALPRYLRLDNYAPIRAGLNRLSLHQAPIDHAAAKYAGGGWHGFNLSDIFEYLDPATCRNLFERLLAVANPGARLAYWNMLVPRRCAGLCPGRIKPLTELEASLFARDKAFFYSAFVVEEVRCDSES